jgi:hypothetical protein
MLTDQLKHIIYWVSLGASLVVYASANFSTKEEMLKLEKKVENQASKEDIKELSSKIDNLTNYLLNNK